MEEKEIYQEEFSFKKFFGLVKRSGKRMLVFVAIAAIIGLCLAVIVGTTMIDNRVYSATIEYTHEGISKGLSPDGSVLNYNAIKSPEIVNAALSAMGYDDATVSRLSADVQDAVSVDPYVSTATAELMKNDPTFEYHPTRFIVSIVDRSISKIKKDKCGELINKIIEEYQNYFKKTFNYKIRLIKNISDTAIATTADYFDLVELYRAEFAELKTALATAPSDYSPIGSQINARVNVLENHLSNIENYILANNVQKENAILTLRTNLTNRKSDNDSKIAAYSGQLADLSSRIDNYNQLFDSVVLGGNEIITVTSYDAAVYNDLVKQQVNVINLKAECEKNSGTLGIKLTTLVDSSVCSAADRAYVESRLNELYSEYSETVSNINDSLGKFTSVYMIKSGVKIVSYAGASSAKSGWLTAVATFVLVLVIGVVAAVIATASAEHKKALVAATSTPELKAEPAEIKTEE